MQRFGTLQHDRDRRALCGGWAAATVFHVRPLNGFFSLSTWLIAIAGSAVLLAAYRAVDARTGYRMTRR